MFLQFGGSGVVNAGNAFTETFTGRKCLCEKTYSEHVLCDKKNWEYRRRIMDDNILDIIFLYIHICSQIMTMLKVPKGAVRI